MTPEIILWCAPRENYPLLVLDIDRTLGEFHEPINSEEALRKHLSDFLIGVYKHYDVAIWSATDSKFIWKKLVRMGMLSNDNFKILFVLDITHMVLTTSPIFGQAMVKPLFIIWNKFPQYDKRNTIIVDDQERNFCLNPDNGLLVAPYYRIHHKEDEELLFVQRVLEIYADNSRHDSSHDFTKENLKEWKSYLKFYLTILV